MQNRIRVDHGFLYLLAILLLTIPLRWIAASSLAGAFHELGHFAAVQLLDGHVSAVDFTLHGARMHVTPLCQRKQLFCLLAGPAASFFLMLLWPIFPRVALCGLAQGVYNLLPFGNQDGAQALRCLRGLFLTRKEKLLAKRVDR